VPVGSVGGGITIRTLDLQTRQFEKPIRIDFPGLTASVQTATGKRLVLSDWSSSIVSSFRFDTGKLEQQWPLNAPPLGYSALAASGKTLAVCDQAGQVSVIDIESDQPPVRLAGYWPIAVSKDGRLVATGSVQKP